MPIYVYQARNKKKSCCHCLNSFEALQQVSHKPLTSCPRCESPVARTLAPFSTIEGKSSFDTRAKGQGFHKLKRVDKGTYEKLY